MRRTTGACATAIAIVCAAACSGEVDEVAGATSGGGASTPASTVSSSAGASGPSTSGGEELINVEVRVVDITTNIGKSGVGIGLNDATGAVFGTAMTGADGSASVSLPFDGSVTVYQTGATSNLSAWTYFDLSTGATIVVPELDPPAVPYPSGTAIHVTVTGAPADAASIDVGNLCADAEVTSGDALLPNDCDHGGELATGELVAVAFDASKKVIGIGATTGIALDPGGTVEATVEITTAFAPTSLTLNNIPSDASSSKVEIGVATDTLTCQSTDKEGSSPQPTSLEVSQNVYLLADTFPGYIADVEVGSTPHRRGFHYRSQSATNLGDVTIDASSFPSLSAAPLDNSGTTPVVSWTQPSSPTGQFRTITIFPSSGNVTLDRQIFMNAADGRTSLKLPETPAEFAAWSIDASTSIDEWGVQLTDASWWTGYLDLLANQTKYDTTYTTTEIYATND